MSFLEQEAQGSGTKSLHFGSRRLKSLDEQEAIVKEQEAISGKPILVYR